MAERKAKPIVKWPLEVAADPERRERTIQNYMADFNVSHEEAVKALQEAEPGF